MKTAGIIMIVSICVFAGCFASYRLRSRTDTLRQLRMMLERIKLNVRYEAMTVDEMIHDIADKETYDKLLFIGVLDDMLRKQPYDHEITFFSAWKRSVDVSMNGLCIGDRRHILNIGSSLGTTDSHGQQAMLEQFIMQTDMLISEAEKEYSQKGKLYNALGMITGAAFVLMTI